MNEISHYYLNGERTPVSETKIHVSDLGLLRGYGIFDFFLVEQSVPLFVEDYIERFFNSAVRLQLKMSFSEAEVHSQILDLIRTNHLHNAALRLLLTGGYALDGITPSQPNFVIMVHPYPVYPAALYRDGAALIVDEYQRFLPVVKTINYLNSIMLQPKMKAVGAVDVLYHEKGLLSETSRSNFFLVTADHTVVTTPGGVLPGITRMKVLEVAQGKFTIEERPIHLDELESAVESFITGSTKKVMPVTKIEESMIGNGKVGSVTASLMDALADYTEKYIQQNKETS